MDRAAEAPIPGPEITAPEFATRVVWIAIRLALVICLGSPGALFVYQVF